MKQQITKKQWNELPRELQLEWESIFDTDNLKNNTVGQLPKIGQMIEFLGDDWLLKIIRGQKYINVETIQECTFPEILCDYLWETVKEEILDL